MIGPVRTLVLTALAALAAALAGPAARAATEEPYPSRPLTFVVPFGAGSGTDLVTRHVGKAITEQTGIVVVVENRPGANAFIGAQEVARAPADGHTVLITTNTTHAANINLFRKLPYSPEKDFEPVTLMAQNALVVVVNPKSAYGDLPALVAALRERPGKLAFASGSSSTRAGSELLRAAVGADALHVPYKSNPQALTDLMGGQFDFMTVDLTPAIPLIQQGKLRALAVTSPSRSPLLPALPTVKEVLRADFELTAWIGAYLPAGTPAPRIQRLNAIIRSAMQAPSVQEFVTQTGGTVRTSTPQELATFGQQETARWAAIVKAAGIEPE